jgi:hypothetical protein
MMEDQLSKLRDHVKEMHQLIDDCNDVVSTKIVAHTVARLLESTIDALGEFINHESTTK